MFDRGSDPLRLDGSRTTSWGVGHYIDLPIGNVAPFFGFQNRRRDDNGLPIWEFVCGSCYYGYSDGGREKHQLLNLVAGLADDVLVCRNCARVL